MNWFYESTTKTVEVSDGSKPLAMVRALQRAEFARQKPGRDAARELNEALFRLDEAMLIPWWVPLWEAIKRRPK